MKSNLYFLILIFALVVSCHLNSKSDNLLQINQDTTYVQSKGNNFTLEFVGFNEQIKATLTKLLDEKTFDENGIEINTTIDGHTFFVSNHTQTSKYVIRIKDVSNSANIFEVNIQLFEKKEHEYTRIANAGHFNLTERKHNSETISEIHILKELIIRLTYK